MHKVIVAVAEGGVIGYQNTMPWQLPEDLAYFKATTLNHTVIMGRNTYLSIGKALPKRRNIVISRDSSFALPDALVYHDLFAAMRAFPDAFIIGGAQIFQQALPYIQRLYLTRIQLQTPGDTFFTIPPELKFEIVHSNPITTQSGVKVDFQVWDALAPQSLPVQAVRAVPS